MNVDMPWQTPTPSAELASQEVEQLLRLQKDILEAVALGGNLQAALDQLCTAAEALVDNSAASIMVYSEDRSHLNVVAAPSIPQDAIKALNGLVPGEQAGSCGTSVFTASPTIVYDTLSDTRWAPLKAFAQDYGIGACWSLPIRIHGDEVIGSFALSSFQERMPTPFQYHLLETGASLAGICIKRQRDEARLQQAAYHDALTGLPNRSLFNDQFKRTLDRAQRNGTGLALMFIDLDCFKCINDTRGHETGDRILERIADAMIRHTRKTDLMARFGGDEFMLLIDDIHDIHEISMVADKMLAAIAEPHALDDREYALTASIGISLFPSDGTTSEILLQRADTAMYEAKARGRSSYCFYEPALTELVDKRLELETSLLNGVSQQEFILHYQPIYEASTGLINSVEALARWNSPTLGMVEPDQFISFMEESGIIKELGLQILETACHQCVAWWDTGLPQFHLSVNLSASQLDGSFCESVKHVLTDTGFPSTSLEIELTEPMLMEAQDLFLEELDNISKLGVCISLDDFGTGHSSLAQLQRLPISKLKIDNTFVHDIPADRNNMIIAKTIIAMGQSLGLRVVAEGVETTEQKNFLVREGCELLQGYLFNRPMPADHLQRLLAELKWSGVRSIRR